MYLPSAFREDDEARLFELIERHPFATLVSVIDGAPFATHLPLLLERAPRRLLGHVARPNPHAEALGAGAPSLAIFNGPHGYVSPRWYVEPNVPTWNYAVVHVHGTPRSLAPDALRDLLERLSALHEGAAETPWTAAALPGDRYQRLLGAVRGFALPIERIEGKFKLSQNRTRADREGALAGVAAAGEEALAVLMRDALERER